MFCALEFREPVIGIYKLYVHTCLVVIMANKGNYPTETMEIFILAVM